jgi:phospholipid/cholesterol/gamma-HCH transport system substrate-binding protein
MKDTRIEVKVGFFVAAGLALLAVVVLSFSKGMTIFERHYKLTITFDSAAGLKPTADVMMAGVTIGQSTGLELTNNGRSVAVKVSILSKYQVRTNAIFHVDALGFLGDQFISVTPSTNLEAGFWQDGGQVQGQSPFNMQEAVRSVSDGSVGPIVEQRQPGGGQRGGDHGHRPPDGPRREGFDHFQHAGHDHGGVEPADLLRETQSRDRRPGRSDCDQPARGQRNGSEFA